MKKRFPLMPIPTIIAAVSLVSAIGGGAWYMGRPPYENAEYAQAQRQSMQQQLDRSRYSQVLADISRLRDSASRRRLTDDETRWLTNLLVERRQLACQLRLEDCK